MRLDQMPGYSFPTLAVWPQPWYEQGSWLMYDYKLIQDGSLRWFKSIKESASGHAKAEIYSSYEDAKESAEKRNPELIKNIDNLNISASEKASLSLKVEKGVTRQSRLLNEEQLMLIEGIRRHNKFPRPKAGDLILPENHEALVKPLLEVLIETPYVNLVRLPSFGVTLLRKHNNDWSTRVSHTKMTSTYFYREKIAAAYGC